MLKTHPSIHIHWAAGGCNFILVFQVGLKNTWAGGSNAEEKEKQCIKQMAEVHPEMAVAAWIGKKNLLKTFQIFGQTLILSPIPDANGDAPICAR